MIPKARDWSEWVSVQPFLYVSTDRIGPLGKIGEVHPKGDPKIYAALAVAMGGVTLDVVPDVTRMINRAWRGQV